MRDHTRLRDGTETEVAQRFAEYKAREGIPLRIIRPGDPQRGEPDRICLSHSGTVGVEISAAIDAPMARALTSWHEDHTDPTRVISVHSSSAAAVGEITAAPFMVRRDTLVNECARVLAQHSTRPYAAWSYFVLNLSQHPIAEADAASVAAAVRVPATCRFLGVYLCYVMDPLTWERRFIRLAGQ